MTKPAKPRVTDFHMIVRDLEVPRARRVGSAVFRPSGWLARRLEKALAAHTTPEKTHQNYTEFARRRIHDLKHASVTVRALDYDDARDKARDSIAILRLFQRLRHERIDTDSQTFGLEGDIDWKATDYWRTPPGSVPLWGGRARGIAGGWTFKKADYKAFFGDPVFVFLDDSLRRREKKRSEMARRAITALRVRGTNTKMLPRPVRVVLTAVALEVLLSDSKSSDAAHRIAQRLAYLTCGSPPHGSARPKCFYLTAKDTPAVIGEMKELKAKKVPNVCGFYWRVRDIFYARNAVAHQGASRFDEKEARNRLYQSDDMIRAILDWIVGHPTADVDRLDLEIAQLP